MNSWDDLFAGVIFLLVAIGIAGAGYWVGRSPMTSGTGRGWNVAAASLLGAVACGMAGYLAVWSGFELPFVLVPLGGVVAGIGAMVSPLRPRLARWLVALGSLVVVVPLCLAVLLLYANPIGY